MIILSLSLIFLAACINGEALSCCSGLQRHSTCKRYCQQVELEGRTSMQSMQQLLTIAEHCHGEMTDLWQCLNRTLPVMRQMEVWSGRPCCDLAVLSTCRRQCQHAKSKNDVESDTCNRESEKALFDCLHRHLTGKRCCDQAVTDNCRMVCHSHFFMGELSARSSGHVVDQHCSVGNNRKVGRCLQLQSRSERANNQVDNIACCAKAKTLQCRTECERVLKTVKTDNEIVDEVISFCGSPDMREALWQCFLVPPAGHKNDTPPTSFLDSAKLQCCSKASSDRCRELCTHTYTKMWAQQWSEFDKRCSFIQPVATLEGAMHNCLTDVEQPCKLGCNGLDFCRNFNFRPTEHFRACTSTADNSARKTIKKWQQGMIDLPQMRIPVKDIQECEPELWKAIACASEIKPCHTKPSPISICQEDCIYILNKCVDYSRLTSDQTVPQLCNPLPKRSEPGSCISVSKYLYASDKVANVQEVTNPCHPNPCHPGETCHVRRRKCKHQEKCHMYTCKAACLLGHMSSFLVPHGSYVRIPDQRRESADLQCHKMCHCGHSKEIGGCSPLPCLEAANCDMGPGHVKEHGSHFVIDKSTCTCNSGRLICSRRTCSVDSSLTSKKFTGLPGNCPSTFHPVCGSNGQTFPNTCLAKCAGMKDYDLQMGPCSFIDPCKNKPCNRDSMCVPRRQVCLIEATCLQYECVPTIDFSTCNHHYHDPVCDTYGEEYTNACILFSHRRKLAYRGHCMSNCAAEGTVCGHNGDTYPSECAALANRITMDYRGDCRAFGNITETPMKTNTCTHVKCPDLRPKHCKGVTPPGACCPICAAELQAIFDPRLVNAASEEMGQGPMNVRVILDMLSQHLMVVECDVFGYLGIEGTIVIIIAPVTEEPTELQVVACTSEAQRLEHLIRTGSPILMSYLVLTPLLLAPMTSPSLSQWSAATSLHCAVSLTTLTAVTLLTILVSRKYL